MPAYDYHCESNGETVEVVHTVDRILRYWAEVCYVAQRPLGETDPLAPVTRVLTRAPGIALNPSNAELKNVGFTKLVRRDDGVFENVTASGDEKRYVVNDDPDS